MNPLDNAIDTTTDPDGKFLFTYRRSDAAHLDPGTTIAVEYGGNLDDGWTTAVHQGSAANQITIGEVPGGPGFSTVTAALPPALATDGRLFVRLSLQVTP